AARAGGPMSALSDVRPDDLAPHALTTLPKRGGDKGVAAVRIGDQPGTRAAAACSTWANGKERARLPQGVTGTAGTTVRTAVVTPRPRGWPALLPGPRAGRGLPATREGLDPLGDPGARDGAEQQRRVG